MCNMLNEMAVKLKSASVAKVATCREPEAGSLVIAWRVIAENANAATMYSQNMAAPRKLVGSMPLELRVFHERHATFRTLEVKESWE